MSDKSADSPALMREWTPRFEYTLDNVDNYVPDLGGVYRLIYLAADPVASAQAGKTGLHVRERTQISNDYYIFYTGQGTDLYKCLSEHLELLKRELPPPPNPFNAPDHCMKRTLQDYQCYFKFVIIRSEKKRIRIKEKLESDFIPKGEMEFALWADNFIRVLSANAAKWFTPPDATAPDATAMAAVAKLNVSHKEYMASYDKQLKSKIDLRAEEKKLKDMEQKLKDAGQWDWDRNRPKDAQQEGEEWKGGDSKP